MTDLNPIIQACSYLLASSPEAEEARSYLDNRLERKTQEQFGFGFFPGAEKLNLLSDFISEEELKEMKLLYSKETADANGVRSISVAFFQSHPLVMPFYDVYGNVVAMVGRSLLSDEERAETRVPKYKNSKFVKGNHLFGLHMAREAILRQGYVYVVEGQFDVIKAMEKGLGNVVALGSADMTAFQCSLLCRYTKNIMMLLDNDVAGDKGRKRARDKYGQLASISDAFLPDGYKDLDEYIGAVGVEGMSLEMRDVR